MVRKREFTVYSLSFLDIMSCGFGAVILIFIVIHHSTEVTSQELSVELLAQVNKIELEVESDQERVVELRSTIKETDDQIEVTEIEIAQLIQMIKEIQQEIAELESNETENDSNIQKLKDELKELEQETGQLKGSLEANELAGRSVQTFSGEGDRQYLTGIKIGGEYILILMDASASMLDETIVNVIRRRNLPDEQKIRAEKWQRAIRTVEWLTANIPHTGFFQLYTFNTAATPTIPDSGGEWLELVKGSKLKLAVDHLQEVVPAGGTSLHSAFAVINQLSPQPDNVYLITDSLPTQGDSPPKGTTVAGKQRERFFEESLELLPADVPVNVILMPMDGDPLAAPNFWYLAQITAGSFLSPSDDWP
jgi:hypothetical protein|tara:strand:+ start:2393 stop:3487 length:1095 start_codon:yes stop_codon:yes gene_type:complete